MFRKPSTDRRDSRPDPESPAQDAGVSWQDDINVRRRSATGAKVASLMGALVFALLGAGLYAVGGWPWQSPGPAVAVTAPQPEPARQPLPQAEPPAAPEPRTASLPPTPPPPEPPPQAAPEPVPPAPPPAAAAAPAPPPTPGPEQLAEARQLAQRASRILRETNDIAAARLFLDRAAKLGDADATFRLAETYDPAWLSRAGARGVAADVARARALYELALDRGVAAARDRLMALR
jgi:outer membrane biosynthesis protein TonB